ncbi:hypothetical protein GCM10022278_17500 [Allohahella marinimesophila]|uniref:Uncharacterized protein n=1 Tax=Allohahella marinimesophila TaxID=1054972 RepID=A0ABP7P5V6_9GAMM
MTYEGLLNWMQLTVLRKAFYRGYLLIGALAGENEAGIDTPAI